MIETHHDNNQRAASTPTVPLLAEASGVDVAVVNVNEET
jgi:hypothetical protein